MISKSHLEASVRDHLENGKNRKVEYFLQGEVPPCDVYLLDHIGRKKYHINGILSDDGGRNKLVHVNAVFERFLKRAIKKHKAHGIVAITDVCQLDEHGSRVSDCLMSHGETKGYAYSMLLPYVTLGDTITFEDDKLICFDTSEGPWTGYFK